MDWYSLGTMAGLGVLGALVGQLLGKLTSSKKARSYLVTFSVVLFIVLGRHFVLPVVKEATLPSQIDSRLSANPAFTAIKEYEPAMYESMMKQLVEAESSGASAIEIQQIVRPYTTEVVETRMPKASSAALLDYMAVMVEEMAVLEKVNGELCYRFLAPQTGAPINPLDYFSKDLLERDFAALGQIIQTFDEQRRIPTEDEVGPQLDIVFDGLILEFGDKLELLDSIPSNDAEKGDVCKITIAMYDNLIKMGSPQGSDALRWMANPE